MALIRANVTAPYTDTRVTGETRAAWAARLLAASDQDAIRGAYPTIATATDSTLYVRQAAVDGVYHYDGAGTWNKQSGTGPASIPNTDVDFYSQP